MKRIICLLLALVMLVGIVPFQVFAEGEPAKTETEVEEENQKPSEEESAEKPEVVEEKTEENKILQNETKETEKLELGPEIQEDPVRENEIKINRKGQWTGESSIKTDKEETYSSVNDPIGEPIPNAGLLRSFAKVFLGWSDLAPVSNGKVAEGAKLFSSQDSLKTYLDHVDKMQKEKGPDYSGDKNTMYAVYYEINGFDKPLASDKFDAIGQVLDEDNVKTLKSLANKNEILLNKNNKVEEILKTKEYYKDNRKSKEDNPDLIDIIGYYYGKDVEVGFKSEFSMDDSMAMLAYKNKTGTNALRPILSLDYNTRYEKDDFPIEKEEYTYVDLNMDFGDDEGLVIPDNLFLEFKSYSWRPLYALVTKDDGTKEKLNILDLGGESKGNTSAAFKDLVSGEKPETKFGVETKGYRKITIRVVLREWDNSVEKPHQNPFSGERIPENKIPKGPDGTIASEILSNMTLRVLGSDDGIKKENIVKISDKKAKELADSNGTKKIDVVGTVEGKTYLNPLGFGIPIPINKIDSNIFSLSLVYKPEEKTILNLDENYPGGKVAKHELDKCEEAGKYLYNPSHEGYEFVGWNYKVDGSGDFVKATDQICENTTVYAIWKAQEKPQAKPEKRSGGLKFNFSTEEIEKHIAYIFGYEDNTVRANGNLTRAEAAAMVTRLAKLDLSNTSKADYKDLEDNAWYLPYINAALKAGMLDAENNNLRPNENISRGEFAKMLAAVDKDNDYVSNFSDVKGHKYEKEINKIDGNKRIEGYEDGSFRPDAFLTRAEAATFLNRMHNRVADDVAIESFKNSIAYFKDLNKDDWFYYEIVEASNTHELTRRGSQDKYRREFEKWTNLIK